MKKQSGFTLIELTVVMGLVGVMLIFMVPAVNNMWATAKFNALHNEVEAILDLAEFARRTVISSASSGTPPVTSHTYITLAVNSTVANLQTALNRDISVNALNPYGRAYLIEITNSYSEVTTIADGDLESYRSSSRSFGGGNTTFTFRRVGLRSLNMVGAAARYTTRNVYLEATR